MVSVTAGNNPHFSIFVRFARKNRKLRSYPNFSLIFTKTLPDLVNIKNRPDCARRHRPYYYLIFLLVLLSFFVFQNNVLSPFTNNQESSFPVILNLLRFPSQRAFSHGLLYRIGVVRTITDRVLRILMPGPIQCDRQKRRAKDK